MPELDAEHREQLAAEIATTISGWLAVAWELGYRSHHGGMLMKDNPYRGGGDG